VNGTCSGDEASVIVLTCSLTALKALVNIMIVGRAAKEIVARERKDLFERLIRAQVRIASDQLCLTLYAADPIMGSACRLGSIAALVGGVCQPFFECTEQHVSIGLRGSGVMPIVYPGCGDSS
jgi:hypothetical protein